MSEPTVATTDDDPADVPVGGALALQAQGARRLDTLLVALVTAACFVGFLGFQRGVMGSWDASAMASVGRNLWFHGNIKECCNAFGAFPLDQSGYAKFGIGMSLVMAPLWSLDRNALPNNALYLTLVGPFLLAASAGVIATTGLALAWRRSTVIITTLAFAFATMAAFYSQTLFSESGVTLGAAIALLGLVKWNLRGPRSGAWLLGGGTALAALFRVDSFALVGIMVLGVVLFARPRDLARTWRQWAPGLVTPVAVVAMWTLLYNDLRFGSFFDFGYGGPYDTKGFSTPLLHGVALQVWSPGKSFFLYSPVLIAAVPGLVWLWRRHRAVAAAVIALSVVRVAFFARWWTPVGGAAWGPRFLLPLCALLAIPLGGAIEHVRAIVGPRRNLVIASFIALGAISVGVQVLAVSTDYGITEHAVTNTVLGPVPHDKEVVNQRHLEWTWAGSPLHRAVFLAQHRPTVLHWGKGGRRLTGILLLLLAAALAAAAAATAQRADNNAPAPYRPRRGQTPEPHPAE